MELKLIKKKKKMLPILILKNLILSVKGFKTAFPKVSLIILDYL